MRRAKWSVCSVSSRRTKLEINRLDIAKYPRIFSALCEIGATHNHTITRKLNVIKSSYTRKCKTLYLCTSSLDDNLIKRIRMQVLSTAVISGIDWFCFDQIRHTIRIKFQIKFESILSHPLKTCIVESLRFGAGTRKILWGYPYYIAYSRAISWLVRATSRCRNCYIASRFFFFFRREFRIEKSVTMNINTRNVNDNERSGHVAIICTARRQFFDYLKSLASHTRPRFNMICAINAWFVNYTLGIRHNLGMVSPFSRSTLDLSWTSFFVTSLCMTFIIILVFYYFIILFLNDLIPDTRIIYLALLIGDR